MNKYELNRTFEMSGATYKTDAETQEVLRSIVPRAKETGDNSAVAFIMMAGLQMGRIVEI